MEVGGGSLRAKGRKLQVAFFAINNNIKNNNKRSLLISPPPPPRPCSRGGGGWERGSPKRRRAPLSGDRDAAETGPAHFFFLFLFFFPFLFQLFLCPLLSLFLLLLFFFSSLAPRPSSPSPRARPSVGEDQVGDAGLEPVSRDHLAHLGRAVVRELEVRTGAGLEVKIQVPVQRRRRAETAQGHALKV